MEIKEESDLIEFARNSKGISDAKVIQVLGYAFSGFIEGVPKDRNLLADRLELFFEEFPEEKPLFLDFNKPSQLGNLK